MMGICDFYRGIKTIHGIAKGIDDKYHYQQIMGLQYMSNWFKHINKILTESESIEEDIMSLFRKKEYTGDKTPNKITPKKTNTGEDQGKMFCQFIYKTSDPKRVLIMYRHYDDPTNWSPYGYIPVDDNQYKVAIAKFVKERLNKNVMVNYKTLVQD